MWMRETNYWARTAGRRYRRRGVLGFAGAATTALFVAACGGDSDDSGGSASSGDAASGADPSGTAQPERGGTLRQGVTFVAQGIDPHIETSVGLVTAVKVYSYLITFNFHDNTMHPLLAEKVEQPSQNEYVFTLRSDAKFQNVDPVNGRAVTADDVKYSLERFRDHPRATRNGFFKNDVASMEVISPTSFKLTTKRPFADTLALIGIGDGFGPQTAIVAREDVEKRGDLTNGGVGSGPYVLQEYVRGERSVLRRNPDYFDQSLPYLDEWRQQVITDNNTLLQAYKSNQLDINGASLTKLDFEDLKRNRDFVNTKVPSLGNGCFEMGAGTKPFNDPRVRQAVKLGIDRGQFIDKLYFGEGRPAGAINGNLTYWALPEEEVKPYVGPDVAKAKSLLSAAGYPNGFDLEIYTSSAIKTYIDYAEIVVAELKKIGINAELKLFDLPTFLSQHMYAGNFPSTVWSTNGYPTLVTPLNYYHKNGTGTGNWWHYQNEEVSSLIDKQFEELDPAKRQPIVKEIQKKVLDDWAPHMPLVDFDSYTSYHKRVGGYEPELGSYQYVRYSEFIKDS
jgi:peptide/nickel transport system substrate-binding protein